MDRQQIKSRLVEILTSSEFGSLQVDASLLDEETSLLNDLALDSIQLLELVVAMENAFEISLDSQRLHLDVFDRFGSVVDFVRDSLAVEVSETAAVAGGG